MCGRCLERLGRDLLRDECIDAPGCDATFSSSLATPVQDAIDTARANAGPDTVRIAAGTWTGNTSETSGLTDAEKTTITGAGSGSTTLTAASGPVLALSGAYSVSGLTIYSSTASAVSRAAGDPRRK